MATEKLTIQDVHDFMDWHEARMEELCYPEQICRELRFARTKFWSSAMKKLVKLAGN